MPEQYRLGRKSKNAVLKADGTEFVVLQGKDKVEKAYLICAALNAYRDTDREWTTIEELMKIPGVKDALENYFNRTIPEKIENGWELEGDTLDKFFYQFGISRRK